MLGWPKSMDSKAVFLAIEKNSESIEQAQHLPVQYCPSPSQTRSVEYTGCRSLRPYNEYIVYDTKQSDIEVPAIL